MEDPPTQTQQSGQPGPTDICRICRQTGTIEKPLFHPCRCSGSMRFVHDECLMSWLETSGNKKCEVCKYKYQFQAIWESGTPDSLPISDVITGIFKAIKNGLAVCIQQGIMVILWLLVLPFAVSTLYISIKDHADYSFMAIYTNIFKMGYRMYNLDIQFSDWYTGIYVILLNFIAIVGLLYLREQLFLVQERALAERVDDLVTELKQEKNSSEKIRKEYLDRLQPNNDAPALQLQNYNGPRNHPPNAEFSEDDIGEQQDFFDEQSYEEQLEDLVDEVLHDEEFTDGEIEEQLENMANDQQQNFLMEITWQKVVGMDGTYAFVEHVFYAYVINLVCLWLFWFVPNWLGKIIFGSVFSTTELPKGLRGISFFFFVSIGYSWILSIFAGFAKLHNTLYIRENIPKLYQYSYYAYQIYTHLKVAMLLIVELLVYPAVIGIWLHVCALQILSQSMDELLTNFEKNVFSSIFFHWLAGMIVVFQFVRSIMNIRTVTRPGLIWFVRNLDDHEYSPLKDMVENTTLTHIKRFSYTFAMLGWVIFVCIFMPSKTMRVFNLLESANTTNSTNSQELDVLTSFSPYFILFQIIIPLLNVDMGQALGKKIFVAYTEKWVKLVGKLIGLESYLVGIEKAPSDEAGSVYQPTLPIRPGTNQVVQNFRIDPYRKNSRFSLRIIAMLSLLLVTMYVNSFCFIYFPLVVGRYFGKHGRLIQLLYPGTKKVYQDSLYSWVFGLAAIWIPIYGIYSCSGYIETQVRNIFTMTRKEYLGILKKGVVYLTKVVIMMVTLGVIMPFVFGTFAVNVLLEPLRVEEFQEHLIFLGNNWIAGLVVQKLIFGFILMTPRDWGYINYVQRIYWEYLGYLFSSL